MYINYFKYCIVNSKLYLACISATYFSMPTVNNSIIIIMIHRNFIIFKQYYKYNYTPHYLKVVYNLLVCYQNVT